MLKPLYCAYIVLEMNVIYLHFTNIPAIKSRVYVVEILFLDVNNHASCIYIYIVLRMRVTTLCIIDENSSLICSSSYTTVFVQENCLLACHVIV